ncbi:MAG TPA: hypothetical protein VJU15_11045 [Gemmatimonadales bacterium]|nr:hypothetical protein [Gemmatimonadales bacterium]
MRYQRSSVFGLLLVSTSQLTAQSSEPVLPFPGQIEFILITSLPDPSRQSYSDSVTVDINGIDGYPASEACFSSESLTSSGTTTVRIHGRKKCSGPLPLLAEQYVPRTSISLRVPARLHLVLPGDSALIEIRNDHINGIPGYRAVFVSPSSRVRLPAFGVAPVRYLSALITCRGRGFPDAVCEGFIGSLADLAGIGMQDPMLYWRKGILPPYFEPYDARVDSISLRQVGLLDIVDSGALDRALDVIRRFTSLYGNTAKAGAAYVQIRTWDQRTIECHEGKCESMERTER